MPRDLCFIEDVTPKSRPTWCVKIRVLEKHPAKGSLNSPKKHQKYIFGDQKGARVQAIIWGTDINLFTKRLYPFKAYYISKAFVKSCSSQYQLIKHPFEWVIHGKTVIEDCEDSADELITAPLYFTPFSEFAAYLNSPVHLDIIAVLMDIDLPRKTDTKYGTSYVQEAVIINQELKPILISFWDSHLENECINMYSHRTQNPVIIIFRAKVGPYNGISLSARNSSGVITAPQIPKALELRQWYDQNKETIQNNFDPADYYSASSTKQSQEKNTKTLAEAINMPENTIFWTRVSISVVDFLQRFYYMSCSNCLKSTGFDGGEIFWCNFCGTKTAIATPRMSMQVQLKDQTGIVQAQIYGELAESITTCKVTDLMHIIEKGDSKSLQEAVKLDDKVVYFVQIKPNENQQDEPAPKKYGIYKVEKIPDLCEIPPTSSILPQVSSPASPHQQDSPAIQTQHTSPKNSKEDSSS